MGRRRRGIRRSGSLVLLLFAGILLLPALVGWGRAAVECRMLGGGAPAQEDSDVTAAGLVGARPEEQTYLTLPEWYIVYSADEYAAFLANRPPSEFPYFRAVGQFWQAYYDVCTVTQDRYPFNSGTHLMLAVIGVSFTTENMFKGIYENTIGRVFEWTSAGDVTPEDAYGRTVAAEYGTFLHTTPWYEFPFWSRLGPLWEMELSGPSLPRRIERRLALSLEYGVKAGYGWAIKQGTESVYAPEDLEIRAQVEGVTPALVQQEPQVRIVEMLDGGAALVALPRYEAFTLLVPRLVSQGVRFTEIAGNDEIMVTVLAPDNRPWRLDDGELLFSMPILSHPGRSRLAIRVLVRSLHTTVENVTRASAREGVILEHIYDY